MNYNQVKILFVLSKSKMNMRGMCPLICRLTYNNKRKEFSTGFLVSEEEWNAKLQIVPSKTAFAKNVNTHLNKMRSEEHTSELQSRPHLVCRLLLEKKNKRKKTVL